MKIKLAVIGIAVLSSSVLAHGQSPYGQVPGPHPAYIHALTDLRAARHYLADGWAWQPVREQDNRAIRQIDDAIASIKSAAIEDGKSLNDPFPIDTSLTPQNRFVKANELLWKAHQDIARAEDVPESRGLRDRALRDIDGAHNTVDNAIRIARWQ